LRRYILTDLDFQAKSISGTFHTNTQLGEPLFFIFSNKELNIEIRLQAHITNINNQKVHFSLPLHFAEFSSFDNGVSPLGIYIQIGNKERSKLVLNAKHLKNKIIYSGLSYQIKDDGQIGLFSVHGRSLTFLCGSSAEIVKTMQKDKAIISDIHFQKQNSILSFITHVPLHQPSKIILVERGVKTEWIKEIEPTSVDSGTQLKINLEGFIKSYYNHPSRWDFYIELVNFLGITERRMLGTYDQASESKASRYFPSISAGNNVLTPYITENKGLSLAIGERHNIESEKINSTVKIKNFLMRGKTIEGRVHVRFPEVQSFQVKYLVLKYRSKTDSIEYKFPILEDKRTQTESILRFTIDISHLKLQNYYWDFYLLVDADHFEYLIRLRNPGGNVRRMVNKKSIIQSYTFENGFWVHPYITAANTIALLYKEKEEHETSAYFLKERLAYYLYILFKWYFDRKDIWLGFEKFSYTAQDNGFYFFQYCYQHNKKKNFYYIIKKDSPDYQNLQDMGSHIIHFMSFKYMVYMFAAKLLLSSESKGHAYDIRVQKGLLRKALDRKRQVFLQHGVLALKRVDQTFKRTSKNSVDLFVVSSNREKELVKKNFGYKDEEIIVTGLSRWDVLTDQSQGQSTILLMPTWRSWMDDLPEDKFIETEYYQQYESLLHSSDLEKILDQYNISLNFFIHPKFKTYIDQFTSSNKRVNILEFGEVQLNELLMQSSLLITDYSSVSWDMYYQKKPIIFYQFDLEDYMKYQGSYIDMEKDLFGDRAYTVEKLIALIKRYAERNFNEENKYAMLRKEYLKYTDRQNSSRIFKEILNHKQQLYKKKRGLTLFESSFLRSLWAYSKRNEALFKLANQLKNLLTDK
jgi:CDP-glycerol glycerophosphotransferase (TagB/SpsB family)